MVHSVIFCLTADKKQDLGGMLENNYGWIGSRSPWVWCVSCSNTDFILFFFKWGCRLGHDTRLLAILSWSMSRKKVNLIIAFWAACARPASVYTDHDNAHISELVAIKAFRVDRVGFCCGKMDSSATAEVVLYIISRSPKRIQHSVSWSNRDTERDV